MLLPASPSIISDCDKKPAKTANVLPGVFVTAKPLIWRGVVRTGKIDRFWRIGYGRRLLAEATAVIQVTSALEYPSFCFPLRLNQSEVYSP